MGITLAATWPPRGEGERLRRFLALIREAYASTVIVVPEGTFDLALEALQPLPPDDDLLLVCAPKWPWGRHWALREALDLSPSATHIHCADMDRLLRWIEIRPKEWRRCVREMLGFDALIVGRSDRAYATHPEALRQTEALVNRTFSHVMEREMDFSAGSKSFSRRSARFLIENSPPGQPFGVDTEWPILLRRAGIFVNYIEVEGLDWETADRNQSEAAGVGAQRHAAHAYDTDPQNWEHRVAIADEMFEAGLSALTRPLISEP